MSNEIVIIKEDEEAYSIMFNDDYYDDVGSLEECVEKAVPLAKAQNVDHIKIDLEGFK